MAWRCKPYKDGTSGPPVIVLHGYGKPSGTWGFHPWETRRFWLPTGQVLAQGNTCKGVGIDLIECRYLWVLTCHIFETSNVNSSTTSISFISFINFSLLFFSLFVTILISLCSGKHFFCCPDWILLWIVSHYIVFIQFRMLSTQQFLFIGHLFQSWTTFSHKQAVNFCFTSSTLLQALD